LYAVSVKKDEGYLDNWEVFRKLRGENN